MKFVFVKASISFQNLWLLKNHHHFFRQNQWIKFLIADMTPMKLIFFHNEEKKTFFLLEVSLLDGFLLNHLFLSCQEQKKKKEESETKSWYQHLSGSIIISGILRVFSSIRDDISLQLVSTVVAHLLKQRLWQVFTTTETSAYLVRIVYSLTRGLLKCLRAAWALLADALESKRNCQTLVH